MTQTAKSELVSIICLSHNQAAYIKDAVSSAERQRDADIELILVDDGSKDGSKDIMRELSEKKGYTFVDIPSPVGNCAAFNKALPLAKGAFVIDLAADDVLEPDRVKNGLASFNMPSIGVNFCDVRYIDELGCEQGTHFKRDNRGNIQEQIPIGDIYVDLIQRYFICPPSMMIRKEVLQELDGYDESLPFEDFDFWIRSSRNWQYSFTNQILVKKRLLEGSLSSKQQHFRNKHQHAILTICKKIRTLNRSEKEQKALRKRVFYEIRQCIRRGNLELIPGFLQLLF